MIERLNFRKIHVPRPTIKNMEDFARACGVSRPTVSKYFQDPSSVRASTRARIEAAVEAFDYRPNIFAMNQNRKETKTIGIVVPYLADPVFAEMARALETRCIASGFRPVVFSAHGDPALEVDILDNLRSMKPAGVLMAPLGRASDKGAVEAFCAQVPTVIFDSALEEFGLAFVGADNEQFPSQIVDYLCRTGEPPWFFEMQTPSNPNANWRRRGYIAAMERLGHAPQVVSIEGTGWAFEDIARRGALGALQDGQTRSRTVLCSNDRLAIGFLVAAFELGLRVGHQKGCDFRVAGMDDHPFARFTCPPLTTVTQAYEPIAQTAWDKLLAAVRGEAAPHETVYFEGQLVMRSSA